MFAPPALLRIYVSPAPLKLRSSLAYIDVHAAREKNNPLSFSLVSTRIDRGLARRNSTSVYTRGESLVRSRTLLHTGTRLYSIHTQRVLEDRGRASRRNSNDFSLSFTSIVLGLTGPHALRVLSTTTPRRAANRVTLCYLSVNSSTSSSHRVEVYTCRRARVRAREAFLRGLTRVD